MIIALPSAHHDHLADALVRDLGFQRQHVDAPLRDLLLALDPIVDDLGVVVVNREATRRLSSKLEQMGGTSDEDRWERLLHPPRPGAQSDRVAAEVKRLLDVLRGDGVRSPYIGLSGDIVIVGVDEDTALHADHCVVAIEGRFDFGHTDPESVVDHWITPSGVVGEQEAIVAYVKRLKYEPLIYDGPVTDADRDAAAAIDLAAGKFIQLSPEPTPPDPGVEIERHEDGSITAYVADDAPGSADDAEGIFDDSADQAMYDEFDVEAREDIARADDENQPA
jgi:hypothetical protein